MILRVRGISSLAHAAWIQLPVAYLSSLESFTKVSQKMKLQIKVQVGEVHFYIHYFCVLATAFNRS